MMSRKGQTEDFFTDIIPAVVLIVIAIVFIAVIDKGEERSVALKVMDGRDSLAKVELVTFLRSDLEGVEVSDLFLDMETHKEYFSGDGDFSCTGLFKDKLNTLLASAYSGWSIKAETRGREIFKCAELPAFGGTPRTTETSVYLPSAQGELKLSFLGEKK